MSLSENLRKQARLRARLGIPVCLAMLLCSRHWGAETPHPEAWHLIAAFCLNLAYSSAMLYATRPASQLSPALITRLTALIDPLLLSLGLALIGDAGQLFACFYLFTILGFGFRIGASAMSLCQAASIAGFIAMAVLTPAWRQHPMAAISVLLFLAVVPLYARSLIIGLRHACEHAEAESRAKTQLLANVSHELRTPLTGIVSSAQLMREENNDPAVQRRSDTILSLSRELMVQINDLLDSAKYGADGLQLERVPFRLADLAAQLRRTLASTALTKGIMLHVSLDERIADTLMGDVFHLGRVLLNLGSNALKFTEHGEVRIRMSLLAENSAACQVRFSCRDTGIGIAPELHQKIFEPFFQAAAGTTRKYGGTGLGMTIVQGILATMDSRLSVRSAPGEGSLFEFDLWLERAPLAEDSRRGQAETVRDKRILVADDNATNLMLIKELLERDGHQVVTAASGGAAIQLLGDTTVDLALVDFNMSDMDGAAVLQIYRMGMLNPAPVYVLTADNTPATGRRLMESGAAGVLHKPIDLATLRAAVAHVFKAGPAPRQDLLATVHYIDQAAIADLHGLGDDPIFFEQLVATAASDVEALCAILTEAVRQKDLSTTRNKAHALKGLSVSVGAVQLASIATRLMYIGQADLQRESAALAAEIDRTTARSIEALRRQLVSTAR